MKVKKHIMFVSYAMRGHANQMIVLAQELVSRGYQVSFVMPDSGKEWLINTAVHFISWKPILKTSDKGFNDAMKQVRCRASREQSARRSQLMVLNMLIDAYIPMYKSLLPIFHKYLPDLLVIAHPVLPAMDLAEKLNLPLIIQTRYLRRSVRNIPKSFDFSASFRLWMNQGVLNLLRQLWLLFQFGIANRRLDHIRKIFFAKVKVDHLFNKHPIIAGTDPSLETLGPLSPLVHLVGPILPKTPPPLDSSLKQWLAESLNGGVVYAAFGSFITFESWQLKALVAGLTDSKFRVLWSLPKPQQHLLPQLTASFRIESFVTQQMVLAHPAVRAFVSHCGSNSILEALYEGKPILALPFFLDQPYYAARLVDLGVALKLNKDSFDYAEVRRKINALLHHPSYTETAGQMSEALKSTGGVDQAADIVESKLHSL